jgi:DNA-binding transcriptional LysR family regulator
MTARRRQLHYLVTVAEEGQITSAARKLHLAQPALSQAISQLEAELGIELLERHPRGVTLTPAGETFLVKARRALAAEIDAAQTAQALARAARGAIAIGFVGPPPAISTPALFSAFAERHPEAQISYQDLPFPHGATRDWLADVDIALCHVPLSEEGLCMLTVRVEPRAVIVPVTHRLAGREALNTAEVLDEAFVSYHPDVQPDWAAFHTLADERGEAAPELTADHALTALQMLGIMTSGRALTALPELDARLARQMVPSIEAIPLLDAAPAEVSLVWREDTRNPLVDELVELAREPLAGTGVADGV